MILEKTKVEKLFSLIENSSRICIVGHKFPDGDCIGSVMALYEFINSNYNKNLSVGFDGKIPFNLVDYVKQISILDDFENEQFDLTIVLDCGDLDRLGKYKCIINNSKHTFCIDHHKTNTMFADINIIDTKISSTGELLYHIFEAANKSVNLKMAEYIYIAIITDTGKFAYSSTSSQTHQVASELIEIGIDISKIDNIIYNSKPFNIVNAYVECISNISFYYNNKLGIAKITNEIVKRNNIDINDLEGIVEFIREVKETEISCVLKQTSENITKVSLRSKNNIDVSYISKKFNGGGHERAAGFSMNNSIEETEKMIVKEFIDYLGE
ncbi:bifunctional oligoribonuclease/PAP phosphatase NrnA [Sedimentibacter sp. zth1]|uniref:DHH family phosphoesterase n=1 Tax=Sedimentibacter sp. zth1 TaxID=2816908 RepID=UPI001A928EDF|nr:bifunctional oligoribonuclease/PAP phosphatase NrnA [Sedimentibacter sp. zth1]QSX06543.1 bifunctional oligoribonuclease/PAP phosphatase NrnA [Sedimentibacter sp. zth1]